jgi:uncharacterized membrane protein YhiD involved in acid resistance
MSEAQQVFYYLSVALAIGLLIGVERGWKKREAKEGARVAGVRTYGLIGLPGGGMALLAEPFVSLVLGDGLNLLVLQCLSALPLSQLAEI